MKDGTWKARAPLLVVVVAVAGLGWIAFSGEKREPTWGAAVGPPDAGEGATARPDEGSRADPALGAREGVQEPAAPEAAPAAAALGVLLFGSLLDPDGERVAEARLTFEGPGGEQVEGAAGAPGSYSAIGLRPGRWTVRVVADGHYPLEAELELPGGVEAHRHDFELVPSVALRVRFLTPEGRRLEEALRDLGLDFQFVPVAVATTEPPGTTIPGVTGRNASNHGVGRYEANSSLGGGSELPDDVSGVLELRAPPPLYVSAVLRAVVLETRRVLPGEEELEFLIDPDELAGTLGQVRVRVVDALGGGPIASGRVDLTHSQRGGMGQPIGPDGLIEFENVLPGIMELDSKVPGYERVKKRVRVPAGEPLEVTLALAPATVVAGRVVGPDGEGVPARMTVVALRHVEMPLDVETRSYFRCDHEGRFENQHVGRGEAMVVVVDPAWAVVAQRVDTGAGPVDDLELRVAEGTPVTVRAEGLGSGLRLTLLDASGAPFWTRRLGRSLDLRLMPGGYRYWLSRDGEVIREEAFTVGAEPLVLELGERAAGTTPGSGR